MRRDAIKISPVSKWVAFLGVHVGSCGILAIPVLTESQT